MAGTAPRTEGAARPTATEPRHFGAATPAAEPRHFGQAAPPRAFGQHGPARTYSYNGHSYAPVHAARYAWPRGYEYRTYAVGNRLPRAFLAEQYYVQNYTEYGLTQPPYGYQWVRYGPDLLLISLASGDVANVVPSVFDEGADQPVEGEQQ